MELKSLKIKKPEGLNIILGQAHFIKTIEDLYESIIGSVVGIKFAIAFCEASGPCLVRVEGNNDKLKKIVSENAYKISAGHSFLIAIEDAFPINILNAIKNVPEVCNIFCATANEVEVILVETDQGCSILGVVDGFKTNGIENEADVDKRKEFLRNIGYKC